MASKWDASADRFAFLEHGFFVQPDQRRLPGQLIAEDMRALLGDQQLGLAVADTPAIQLVVLDGFNDRFNRGCWHAKFSLKDRDENRPLHAR